MCSILKDAAQAGIGLTRYHHVRYEEARGTLK
jgi:hypothetical protein